MVPFDVVVIGGGSGGLTVAAGAAQLGAKVALIDKARLGGDCLWQGCVPSKALIHVSRIAHQVRHSDRWGIPSSAGPVDFRAVRNHVAQAIQRIEPHDSPARFQGLGVEVLFGEGQFVDRATFRLSGRDLKARTFCIATGSRPQIPPIPGLSEAGFITNEDVFTLPACPPRLVVLGGGPIGLELGQALHRLGSEVTVLQRGERILPREDTALAAILHQALTDEGITIKTGVTVNRVEGQGDVKILHTNQGSFTADAILVATGRQPNLEGLGLKEAGVGFNERGIQVDAYLATTNPRIFACGDVTGGYKFTHVAGYEGTVIVRNALLNLFKAKADYRVIPWTTFTDPEVAHVGLTEAEAKDQGGIVLEQPFKGIDRAITAGEETGLIKIIIRPDGTILGAHIIGQQAGELLQEWVLAMKQNLKVGAISASIHPYPTLSLGNQQVSGQLTKQRFRASPLPGLLQALFSQLRNWS
ncbi:NAD(P)/FAD-dependent oxidoreductase [Candidatus Cyanaurora vandensis]|uniref:dihydrolipoyl dehydrogenase family protein n=1 Tax=Candidatus Cyanaurora vandensis TaxID=2714958 RepID=UPI0025795709|nr:FAD-dependent oxidoreductase [Candidatus Cyanaurora vandensis]